jgi:hypothetical protein
MRNRATDGIARNPDVNLRAARSEVDALDFVSTEPIMAFIDATISRGRAWPVAIVSFGLYYGGSAFAAWLSGTLCAPASLAPGSGLLNFRWLLRAMTLVVPPQKGHFVPLLSDIAHLNFSILICLIAFPLSYKFFQVVPAELHRYFASGAPKADSAWVLTFFVGIQQSVARRWHLVLAAVFGILSGLSFVVLARSGNPEAQRWWGHSTFGLAGYYLAAAQALCCYYTMWGVQVLLIINRHILIASERIQRFLPFYSDGYYGFRPLAQLLLWEAVIVLLGGLALFSTYYLGYFGLEKMFLMLLSMMLFTVGTGGILGWPVIGLTKHVRDLRRFAIEAIEPRMHKILHGFIQGDVGRSERESQDELASLISLHDALKTSRTVPFGFASFNTVILGYGVQVAILLREFYGRFRITS